MNSVVEDDASKPGRDAMGADEKCIQEVAFEWLCISGAFKQLQEQCESYATDCTEKTVYRFVLEMDLMLLLDYSAELGNLVINQPMNAVYLFQEICYVTIRTLSWIPHLLAPSQVLSAVRFSSLPSLKEWTISDVNLSGNSQPKLMKIVGIVCGITAVNQYTQSARYYCPYTECVGSAKHCYIRVHVAGKTEDVTVRSNFMCRYCESSLIEDATCRTLADKCIVQVLSPMVVSGKLWIGTGGEVYQAVSIYVRDELIKEVKMGGCFSFVVLPLCEIHETSMHYQCTPVFEANNLEKIDPSPFLTLIPASLPWRVKVLYEDRVESPWSFVASLAYCFGGSITPPGTYLHLKLTVLLNLVLLHCCDSPESPEHEHTNKLHLLVISGDLLRIQRILLHAASFAKRITVYSPISELSAGVSRDPFGSGTCLVNAGCIPLATGGVCLIPNVAVLKKEEKDKLQSGLENGTIAVKVPEKYWTSQGQQLSLSLNCSLWACTDASEKNKQSGMLDPMLTLGPTIPECSTMSRAFMDRFSLVFNFGGSAERVDNCDESVSEETLRRAMGDSDDEASLYISDEEIAQLLHYAASRSVTPTTAAQDLIQGFYLANRRASISLASGGSDFPASALQTLTSLAVAHAKLSLRSQVLEEDAVVAIMLYEDSIRWKHGYSALGLGDPPTPSADVSKFLGPENDLRMQRILLQIRRFRSTFKDGWSSSLGDFHEE